MELGLERKNVLVTGGSRGIGLACARVFLAEGSRVAIASRSPRHLEEAAQSLGRVMTAAADLSIAAAAAAVVERVEAELGPVDILVNSAGAARRTSFEELTPEAWRAAMDAKYFTYINVIDPMIKRMAARGRGVTVNVIGQGGKVPSSIHLPGGAANAALMLASAGLALGITEQEALQRTVARLPLGRLASPEEIADVVAFAASERGRYLTGANNQPGRRRLAERGLDARTTSRRRRLSNALRPPACVASR